MIKAVIFDMDGLIIDSEPIESKSLEILLRKYGKTPEYQESGLIHTVGTAGNTYNVLKEKYKLDDDIKVLRRKKRRIYTNLLKRDLIPFKGFSELITILKNRKIKTALASNRNRRHLKLILKLMGIINLFDVIVGPSAKRKHKPSPDIYLTTAQKLNVYPDNCIVLEDSETGVTAGKAAGMKVIAIPNKYTKNQNLTKADIVVDSLEHIKWGTLVNI